MIPYDHRPIPDDGSLSAVSILHNDYHDNFHLYQNHTKYDCLKAYLTPYTWRPSRLIMVSSNTSSSQQLNSSAVLARGIIKQGPHDAPQPLCMANVEMAKACSSLHTLNDQKQSKFVFMDKDLVIDYCLFKATDVSETLLKTCHLESSPQILIGITIFSDISCRTELQLICHSRCKLQCGKMHLHLVGYPTKQRTNLKYIGQCDR